MTNKTLTVEVGDKKYKVVTTNTRFQGGLVSLPTVSGITGLGTEYQNEERRVSVAETFPFNIIDEDEPNRFSNACVLNDPESNRNLFVIRDHLKNLLLIVPDMTLGDDVYDSLTGVMEVEFLIISEISGTMSVTTTVDPDTFVINNLSRQLSHKLVDITIDAVNYPGNVENRFFSLGSLSDLCGPNCRSDLSFIVPTVGHVRLNTMKGAKPENILICITP